MLRSVKSLRGYQILAQDGEIGKIHELLFDDQVWVIRYFVVDTGNWLPGRKVILPPHAFGQPDWVEGQIPVNLTRKQVEEAPPIDADEPVSRQHETALHQYFEWRPYWLGGAALESTVKEEKEQPGRDPEAGVETGDPTLRSTREVIGYHIEATDGPIGHVDDFIVDDVDWQLRYMVVDTKNWLPGRKVLVALSWIDIINWAQRLVNVDLTRDRIERSPEFDPAEPVNRRYEEVLYDYYGRPRYWA
jgi:hypothetical protein